jgi:hypothetical protein
MGKVADTDATATPQCCFAFVFVAASGAVCYRPVKRRKADMKQQYPGVRIPPKKIYFKYPNGHTLRATVTDEVYAKGSGQGGDYLFVVQRIVNRLQPRKKTIRFGYYRKENHETRWRWGSQTTFHTDRRTTERIIRKAIARGLLRI